MKNNFAPVNRIPGAVLSLIPNYWERRETDTDEALITLTHVCRGWRELFISQPSLWTRLDFSNAGKTHAYVKRSRSLPLEAIIKKAEDETSLVDAFLPAVPHITRFKSLTITGTSDLLQSLTEHLTLATPLLEKLVINSTCKTAPVLDDLLFNRDLSSLRILSLGGVTTRLPWKNLRNLTTFELRSEPGNKITVMRLLDFFASTPHLRDITLRKSIPTSSNASSTRVVPLLHVKNLTIIADRAHSILLNHLCIPAGASLILDFEFICDKSPLPNHLPKTIKNLENVFRITTVNLYFDRGKKFVQLIGPSGSLCMYGRLDDLGMPSLNLDGRILQSLDYFPFHITQRLAITKYEALGPAKINKSFPYQILLRMMDLRTLTLTRCNNLPFILALNPVHNSPKVVPCPNLEELILYVKTRDAFNMPELMSMAKERELEGMGLQSVTIVGLGELIPGKEVFKLREHVPHVEYRFEEKPPRWNETAN